MHSQLENMTESRVATARSTLTHRMAALERRVVGQVEGAAQSVRGAAMSLSETVTGAATRVQQVVGAASDGVQSAFDVPSHIRRRPWASLGAAAVGGFLAGIIPGRRPATSRPNGPGVFDDLWSAARRELVALGETAIGAAGAAARIGISERLSQHAEQCGNARA